MSIQWFPGHMIGARKKAAESMRMIDACYRAAGFEPRPRSAAVTPPAAGPSA